MIRSASSKAPPAYRIANLPLEHIANGLRGKESALMTNPRIREVKGKDVRDYGQDEFRSNMHEQ
jgi:hypothetical protein